MNFLQTPYVVLVVILQFGMHSIGHAQAPNPATITAEQCAVVLNDVKAGRDISINVKCDIPTEQQILTQLLGQPFSSECIFRSPKKWAKLHPVASVELVSMPQSGDYFSQFDFRYIVYQSEQSEVEKAFLFGSDVILDGEKLSPWMKENHTRLLKFRESNSGYILPNHVLLRAQGFDDYFGAKDALATARVRANIQYEDGSQVESGQLYVFKEEKLVTEVLIYPTPNPYPRLSDKVVAYTFRCEAEATMKPKTFANLCAGLIERTTLGTTFGSRTCKNSGSEVFRKYIFTPAPTD